MAKFVFVGVHGCILDLFLISVYVCLVIDAACMHVLHNSGRTPLHLLYGRSPLLMFDYVCGMIMMKALFEGNHTKVCV